MAGFALAGDTSGQLAVNAPAVAGSNTLTLQAATATSAVNTLATAVASTSGTSIDFTGLPAWVKRITVMFKNVSTNSTSNKQIQLGAGSVTTTGYQSSSSLIFGSNSCTVASVTTGFLLRSDVAADELSGHYVFTSFGGNSWVGSSIVADQSSTRVWQGAGRIDLGGTLDRVRITTVNGTDTFDAGSVNILYEG